MAAKIRVTVWNEGRHEKKNAKVAEVYPKGIHGAIAEGLATQADMTVRTATLDDPEHGLTEAVLADTDVLTWWGHMAHKEVTDEIVARVQKRVLQGMGLIVLHSGHYSKIFRALMGTTCQLKWREAGEREVLWVTCPGHPILQGIDDHFILEHTEMYGEHFDIPNPDEQLLISSFAGGEVFRSGCLWRRGAGMVFYFRPGHETYPIFYDANVRRILANAVRHLAGNIRGTMKIEAPRKEMGWWQK